jgi:hypothetical protein
MNSTHKTFILIALSFFCSVVFGALRAEDGDNETQGNNVASNASAGNYLKQLQSTARVEAEENISKELVAEYEAILAWLKTRKPEQSLIEERGTEHLAIKLLGEVRWLGALDFFIENIVWHTWIQMQTPEFTPKWVYFPCAMALVEFKGCEFNIARAALMAKRDIEMQLLCIALMHMATNAGAEYILLFSAGEEKQSHPRLKAALTFIRSFTTAYDVLEWDPYDCKDFDDPRNPIRPVEKSTPALPGTSEVPRENNSTPPTSEETPLSRDGSTPNTTHTGTSSEGAVAAAAPFPWVIVIVVAIAALSLGAITTLLLTRKNRREA